MRAVFYALNLRGAYLKRSEAGFLNKRITGGLIVNNEAYMTQPRQQSGFRQFQEQRARLRSQLDDRRVSDTERRFNALSETQQKALFLLANEAARQRDLPLLRKAHIGLEYAQFTKREQLTVMLGVKRLAELAAAIPWCWPDREGIADEHIFERNNKDKTEVTQ